MQGVSFTGEMFNTSDLCKAGLLLGGCLIQVIPVRRVFYWGDV